MLTETQIAWAHLFDNFFEVGGCIYKKDSIYEPTDIELESIKYLCEEWDYSFYPGRI